MGQAMEEPAALFQAFVLCGLETELQTPGREPVACAYEPNNTYQPDVLDWAASSQAVVLPPGLALVSVRGWACRWFACACGRGSSLSCGLRRNIPST